MNFRDVIANEVGKLKEVPATGSTGAAKKNYTEKLSRAVSSVVAAELRQLGLTGARYPERGHDKQFMGGYGTKGVDVYVADDKHGLLLTSGTKGLVYDPRKNLKNRYRDMVMEALELHKRFPYAVCGHLFFLGRREAYLPSKRFGTVIGEAVALLSMISGRARPEDAPELYETMGILVLEPGDPASVELTPIGVPASLAAAGYLERLIGVFNQRNPFYTP